MDKNENNKNLNKNFDKIFKIKKFDYAKIFKLFEFIYKNYSNSETHMLAITLTYFSLLALFPIIALALGITKGFGLDKVFIQKMFSLVPQSEGMIREVLEIANKLLQTAQGSILTGVGIVVLVTSVIKLIMMLENSFNKIWHVSKKRSYTRRVLDSITVIFVGPIVLIMLLGTNSFVIEQIDKLLLNDSTIVVSIAAKIASPIFYIFLITIMFYFIPNTNVKVKSALIAGIITYLLCVLLKLGFGFLQGSISRYNAIYGSLAFIPVFLIWIQYMWVTILLGCQIAFSVQSSDKFLYNEKIQMPIRIKKEITLIILALIIKRFKNGQSPYTYIELSKKIGIDILIVKDILSELEKMGYVNEIIIDKNEEIVYQIAIDPESFYISDYVNKLENENIEDYKEIFSKLSYEEIKMLEKIKENTKIEKKVLIKDLI